MQKMVNKSDDEIMIQEAFDKLLNEYLKTNHRRKIELITEVFNFANQAHAETGARRKNGDPYIMHPIAVAHIVCTEMGLGSTSICSALLHDVIEDTDYTKEDIEERFGEKIAQIVEGLTKISGGKFGEKASAQAENFKKLLLTMNSDIRVILIKIADRLHNMRTLELMDTAKQYKIAGETLYIYAPLAHRLGFFSIKTELEDLSFKYEHPKDYADIHGKLKATEISRNLLFEHFAEPLRAKLDSIGLTYEMHARVKSAYSIWNKMQNKRISFDDIYDLYAVRIVFEPLPSLDDKDVCWKIYNAITEIYELHPNRIRDWVNRPKANGYQAIHITAMGPDGKWIEVQIRSQIMDEIAEKGFAAHWKYKGSHVEEDNELGKWLQTITEILENPNPNALDFLGTIKLDLFAAEISIFTPKGDIKTMPQGATALDFAYALHTDIGNRCIGAKVNNRLVPLSHILASGDQVEILTSQSQEPQQEWIQYVATAKARTKIDEARKRIRKEAAKKGEEKLLNAFRRDGIEIDKSKITKVANYFGFLKREDLFYSLEKGNVTLPDNIKKILKAKSSKAWFSWFKTMRHALRIGQNSAVPVEETEEKKTFDKKKPYILSEELLNIDYVIAKCCKPIPGDDVLGFINDEQKVEIHKRSCTLADKLKSSYGNRLLSIQWSAHKSVSFEGMLEVKGIDDMGVLNMITEVISNEFNVNIQSLWIETKDGVFEGKIKLRVHDVEDIQQLCVKLSKIKNIKSVWRVAD